MKMNKKLVFSLAAVLLVAVTTLTFAHTSSAATVTITGATTDASNVVLASTLTTKLPNSTGSGPSYTQTAPVWTPVVNVPGSITAGDVYDIDTATSAYAGDIRSNRLPHQFRFTGERLYLSQHEGKRLCKRRRRIMDSGNDY